MITPHDHAKVLDLGLALIDGETVEDATVVGGQGYIVGTMDYIAPEQTLDAASVDRRCDLYALGCTLYFALTGQPPFPGGTSKEKIHRHRGETPTPLARAGAGPAAGLRRAGRAADEQGPGGRPAVGGGGGAGAARLGDAARPSRRRTTRPTTAFDEESLSDPPSSSDFSVVSLP